MKPIETPEHIAAQAPEQRFQASYREAWGVYMRLLQEDYLKAAFTRREDADAYANKHLSGGQRGEVRRLRVIINETLGEVYSLAASSGPVLQAVDLDFNHKSRMNMLRRTALNKLTDDELAALGVKRG